LKMSLETEIRRANQNVFEIETKLRALITESGDVTFNLIDPVTGESIPITHPSFPKMKSEFENWKKGFQGTLSEAFTYPELAIVVSPTGGGDGGSHESPTDIQTALSLLPKLSKYTYISIALLDGTYDLSSLNIKIPHLTNYVRFRKSDFASAVPVLNIGSIEAWGAARIGFKQVHVIANITTTEAGISVRDGASIFMDNTILEAPNAGRVLSIYNGGVGQIFNSTINANSNTAIHVSRGDLKADGYTINNANIGLQALAGARIWRENATYTNCITNEDIDAYSVVQP